MTAHGGRREAVQAMQAAQAAKSAPPAAPRCRARRFGASTSAGSQDDANSAPLVEIFGGIFALLLVLFLMMNLISQAAVAERLESATEEGLYRVGWSENGAGFVVLAFPGELRIVETGDVVDAAEICQPDSPFVNYARKVYRLERQQIIFAVLEQGVPTMAASRNCLMRLWPERSIAIGWIIADDELLKLVSLNDIPSYIRKAVATPPAEAGE